MTLAQLRVFVTVVQHGSVRAAAESLCVTQSAVSASLAALQRSVGLQLVARQGRGLRLTEAGRIYVDYAERALGLLDAGQAAVLGQFAPERGRVRLASVTTAGEQLVPPILASFRSRFPHAEVALEVGNRETVWDWLNRYEADLAVAGHPPPHGRFASQAVRPHDLVVVGPPGTRVDEPIESWLSRETWLLREHGSGTRATTEAFLDARGLTPPRLTVGSNVAIRESVSAGLGITLISRDAVGRELAAGTLEVLDAPGTPLKRDWHLVARAGEGLPATAALLLEHATSLGEFTPVGDEPTRVDDPARAGSRAAASGA